MANLSKILASVCLVLAAAGCEKATEPSSDGSTAMTSPKAGSSYVYEARTIVDSSGEVTSTRFDTFTVIATGADFEGRKATSMTNGSDVFYMIYRADGDLEIWNSGGTSPGRRSGWMRVPVGTKGQHTFIEIDTMSGSSFHRKETITHTYLGEETVQAANESHQVAKIEYQETSTHPQEPTYVQDIYFSRKLGFFVMADTHPKPLSWKQSHTDLKLVSYHLK